MCKWFPLLVLSLTLFGSSTAKAVEQYFEDATLYAVQFVGDAEGWAAGEEGVIWHTIDGGKNWERVPSGTRGTLKSICFITPEFGWIVGREELIGGKSAGVILVTTDGGNTWNRVLPNSLPGLNRVRFVDGKTGFLLGDGSDQVPSGLFKTSDSGKTWTPVPGPRATTWLDGDFADGEVGALGGAWSRLAKLRLGSLTAPDVDNVGGRNVRGLRFLQERAIAVGDGGLVLTSKSQGAAWGYADLKLPADVLANLDFQNLDSVGNQVWVVGRPGSVILHSKDGGLSWQLQNTGQNVPLHGIYFRDEDNGCAVGAMGTVLTTSDSGKTWKVQRQGGKRAAAMFLHADPHKIPVEAIAQLGLEDGFLVTGLRLFSPDPKTPALARATEQQRFAAALRLAGGVTAESLWQFPLPQNLTQGNKKQLLEFWDGLHNKQAAKEILRQLVLSIRLWKPDVVITDNPDDNQAEGQAESLVAEAVNEAVKLAADAEAFPEQIKYLGLQPWKVSKWYARWNKQASAQVAINNNEVKLRLLSSLRDFTAPASELLDRKAQGSASCYFRLLGSNEIPGDQQPKLMAGVTAISDAGARRNLRPESEPDPELVKAVQSARHLQNLIENPTQNIIKPEQLIAQLKPVLGKLPQEQGAAAAFAMANQFARSGQWVLANEAFSLMADQYPTHPLTAQAYRWLIQHNTGSEAQRRYELGQYRLVKEMTVNPAQFSKDKEKPDSPVSLKESQASTQAQMTFFNIKADLEARFKNSQEYAKQLDLFGPIHAKDPAVQFCLQAANRANGNFKTSHEWFTKQKNSLPPGPWQKAATAEYWLVHRQGPLPKAALECFHTNSRPYLDGNLTDSCWNGIKPFVLEDAVAKTTKNFRTEVRLVHDQEFLYLALSCTHPPECHVAPVKARPRDGDLRAFDRVSLYLDLDRDYSTYFHFQVDQRGCVAEDCWGDSSWNPKWFVAVRSDKTSWTIEAAIPLSQLTSRPIGSGEAWACNLVRIVPQQGVQSLSQPADVEPQPEGMGLLLFQTRPHSNQIQPVSHIMPTAH